MLSASSYSIGENLTYYIIERLRIALRKNVMPISTQFSKFLFQPNNASLNVRIFFPMRKSFVSNIIFPPQVLHWQVFLVVLFL